MQFIKEFRGVKEGEIYPTTFQPGDDCPAELESAAIECGVVDKNEAGGSERSNGNRKK